MDSDISLIFLTILQFYYLIKAAFFSLLTIISSIFFSFYSIVDSIFIEFLTISLIYI